MLDEIIKYKKIELSHKVNDVPYPFIEEMANYARPVRNFLNALLIDRISVIAEIKHRSPSKGIFRDNYNAMEIAQIYNDASVNAISVLGDEKYFGGGADVVRKIANTNTITVPILFKDFILSKYQILEARACGADAILLIVRIVSEHQLKDLILFTESLGMSALVETFTKNEIQTAIHAGAKIIGINNRDLSTFNVNFDKTREMISSIPSHIIRVSESGISNREELQQMKNMGFNAALIGESILRSENIADKVKEFINL